MKHSICNIQILPIRLLIWGRKRSMNFVFICWLFICSLLHGMQWTSWLTSNHSWDFPTRGGLWHEFFLLTTRCDLWKRSLERFFHRVFREFYRSAKYIRNFPRQRVCWGARKPGVHTAICDTVICVSPVPVVSPFLNISLHMSLVSLVPSRPRRFRMCRHLSSLSGNIVLLTLSSSLRENSLRSKRFRLVSEQKKTVKGDLRVWSREKLSETQKMK